MSAILSLSKIMKEMEFFAPIDFKSLQHKLKEITFVRGDMQPVPPLLLGDGAESEYMNSLL